MGTAPANPWHKASFDEFLHRRLPQLLTRRLGVSAYRAEAAGENACRIVLAGRSAEGDFEIEYTGLPTPDEEGVFRLPEGPDQDGGPRLPPSRTTLQGPTGPSRGTELVVLPVADRDDLSEARISCLGDRLSAFVESRLGLVPGDAALDRTLVRTLAPLRDWFHAFLASAAEPLDSTNWLARAAHLRRILIPDRQEVFTPGHFGRTCPFETPEGPNIGRVLTISRGAEIRDGRLVIVDGEPPSGLGMSSACVPFLEHDDGNRVLMGVNMMRQWVPPEEREAALVRTGLEPQTPGFWCGRNLLTALVSWDADAFEDAVLVSRSCARKLACPEPLEPGDKLSNRHGIKGVVSRVAPDDEMPRLPDGTPVELVFSFSGIPSRWVMGLVREAALGHAARLRGAPAVVPPFEAPSDEQLRGLLRGSGLRDDGMTTLTVDGTCLRRPSAAGWVYWGCTHHRSRPKLRAAVHPDHGGQRLGLMEVRALAEAGAPRVIQELTNTCSSLRTDADSLSGRVASGPIEPASTPSPAFAVLASRLARAGIQAEAGAEGVAFRRESPRGPMLSLAADVPHPWLSGESLSEVCEAEDAAGYEEVAGANARLARLREDGAPGPLIAAAREDLAAAVSALYDGLATAPDVGRDQRILGRPRRPWPPPWNATGSSSTAPPPSAPRRCWPSGPCSPRIRSSASAHWPAACWTPTSTAIRPPCSCPSRGRRSAKPATGCPSPDTWLAIPAWWTTCSRAWTPSSGSPA